MRTPTPTPTPTPSSVGSQRATSNRLPPPPPFFSAAAAAASPMMRAAYTKNLGPSRGPSSAPMHLPIHPGHSFSTQGKPARDDGTPGAGSGGPGPR
eukprot:CAMPEP_0194780030 /NCGR_PEP_ID=MMETSP0323_2-20130528/72610_1 /TAXON_ID=2866 ORGANISM="Crypthecodinium cohnii, Strain Seligo" /NCGR_SAMPLE_ID=MMETSP0323_2 /ASSEMBLY_ACC=CAM_ASM_000346 /LENGTH=95 /DNA_ID=CAMNT_0039717897 /DNA_START=121 /DNA_END=405 /DNA_ORIENTATION=+